jgi:arylsulfatase
MKKLIAFIIVMLNLIVTSYGQQPKRPNVIIVLSDDQGYGDFSCNGNPVLQTPALDQLAQEAIQFSDFHVSPYCTPTRGQLLSGMDALHNKAATVGAGRNTMRHDIQTMPEIFRQNGYRTGIFGKWHLGDNYPDRPMDRGFEKAVWIRGWGLLSESEYDNDYYRTRYMDGNQTIQSEKYCTDLWFDEAMKWMGEISDQNKPFFVYLPTNAPHGPFHAPKEDYNFYKNKVSDSATAGFFGMLRNIDNNMARLNQWLIDRRLKENTIIIYMNDNGGTGGVNVYNAGMRGKKGEVYEGGHRAVCFFRWPAGKLGTGRTITAATQVQDLLPTFIDLLKFKSPVQTKPFDGVSLVPLLKQKGALKDRMFVVQYGGSSHPEKYFSCVAWNQWRLVGNNELYNIRSDPAQQHNIAKEHPEKLQQMLAVYNKWWDANEKEMDQFVPIVIGAPQQSSVVLTADFWANGDYVNTQWKVAQVQGPPAGGTWHIKVEQEGWYKAELSRWPFHLNQALNTAGITQAVGGTPLRTGKSLPVEEGCLSVNERTPVTAVKKNAQATLIEMTVKLSAKDNTLRAWFRDGKGKDLCGSYYLRLTPITDESLLQSRKNNTCYLELQTGLESISIIN